MKTIIVLLLSIIQIPCFIEGWISYFLNSIVKLLSSLIFFLAIISFVWWPLDMLCGSLWAGCEYIKRNLLGDKITFSQAVTLYTQLFPSL